MKKNPHFRQLDISASGQLDNPTCRHLELHISTTRHLEISMTWNSWLEKWTSRQLPWTLGGSVERRNVTSQKLKFVKLLGWLLFPERPRWKTVTCQKSACWCKWARRYNHCYAPMTPYESFWNSPGSLTARSKLILEGFLWSHQRKSVLRYTH